jgi:hypothetical protein
MVMSTVGFEPENDCAGETSSNSKRQTTSTKPQLSDSTKNLVFGHRWGGRAWHQDSLVGLIEIGMDWIDLAQCRDQWRALMNTVMNLRVS